MGHFHGHLPHTSMGYLSYHHSAYLSTSPESSGIAIICACRLCPFSKCHFTTRHTVLHDRQTADFLSYIQVCGKALVGEQGKKIQDHGVWQWLHVLVHVPLLVGLCKLRVWFSMSKKVKTKSVQCMQKLLTEESMTAAAMRHQDGKGLRDVSRLYNVPLESSSHWCYRDGASTPEPATVLTEEQEERLSQYLIHMSEIGNQRWHYVSCIQHARVNQAHHPFKNGKAGHGWFEGFISHHPKLTLHKPQPLSHCWALCANKEGL